MISVLRRYQQAAGNSKDSRQLRAEPHSKFLVVRPFEEPNDCLRAILFFAAWHARSRGPVFVLGAPEQLRLFWCDLHSMIEDMSCRRRLAFQDDRLIYVSDEGNWTVMQEMITTPSGWGNEPAYRIPLEESALWVILDWNTVPKAFLAHVPLGLIVPRWKSPAML